MNANKAMVIFLALILMWNVFLWSAFLYVVAVMDVSPWVLLIPCLFTVFPKSHKNKDENDE